MPKKKTNFEYGFNTQGKRTDNTGEDVISIYAAPEDWDTPTYAGTPVNIVAGDDMELEIADDGTKPEFLLYSRVDDKLSDMEWVTGEVMRDEVEPGQRVDIYPFKKNAIISTELLADDYDPSEGDELYIEDGKFTDSDPTGDDSGEVVAEVKQVDVNGTDYVRAVLK